MLSNSGVPIKAKAAIRGLLPSGLREAISKVRSSVAYAVSAIAHWDWPEAWPQLFTLLMEMLVSGDVNAVHGAMRVLTGKWSNTHTHTEVVHVHPLKSVTVVSSTTRCFWKLVIFVLFHILHLLLIESRPGYLNTKPVSFYKWIFTFTKWAQRQHLSPSRKNSMWTWAPKLVLTADLF